jgi:hypothetical protein
MRRPVASATNRRDRRTDQGFGFNARSLNLMYVFSPFEDVIDKVRLCIYSSATLQSKPLLKKFKKSGLPNPH